MSNPIFTVHASAAETATANGSFMQIPADLADRVRGVILSLDITAASGTTPTLDIKVQRHNVLGADFIDLPSAAFAQKTATGTDDLIVYPGIAETANRSVSDICRDFRLVYTIGGTTPSFTFSIQGEWLV